jgi:hypothetical protein
MKNINISLKKHISVPILISCFLTLLLITASNFSVAKRLPTLLEELRIELITMYKNKKLTNKEVRAYRSRMDTYQDKSPKEQQELVSSIKNEIKEKTGHKFYDKNDYGYKPSVTNGEPDFDGGYIKTQKGTYLDIQGRAIEGGSVPGSYKAFSYIYKKDIAQLSKKEFKGMLIKGQYNFTQLQLHAVINNDKYKRYGKVVLEIKRDLINIRTKPFSSNGYYMQPSTSLSKGIYVLRIQDNLWPFELQ